MSFRSWLREGNTISSAARHHRARGCGRATGTCLAVERLDDRTLLSAGALDATFGAGGLVTTDFGGDGDVARAVVLQADGKIVVAGEAYGASTHLDFVLARYDADGSPDAAFGSGGKVTTNFGGFAADRLDAIAIYPLTDPLNGGKIVATGVSENDFALARCNADGSLDSTFGTGGLVTTNFVGGVADWAHAVVIQADGKIVVAGASKKFDPRNYDFALARYNADGSLDASFGTGGTVTTDFFGNDDEINAISLQRDGKIVVAGYASRKLAYTFTVDIALARYDTSGNLDPTFGTGGKVTTPGGSFNCALALQADGKIVLAGTADGGRTQRANFGLTRFNPNGSLDTTFGKKGKVTTDFASTDDYTESMTLQANGKIVVAGSTVDSNGHGDFALARYNANGSLDTGFGNGGKVTSDFGATSQWAKDVALQADGKIVAAGITWDSSTGNDFALARYLGDAPASPLQVHGGAAHGKANREALTSEPVQPLLDEALARWHATGADISGLSSIDIRIADLGGATLGLASGNTIWLDDDAAGWGWYVDADPKTDIEFTRPGNQGEQNRMDLLTVLAHEVGHLLGYDHEEDGVMAESLAAGVRSTPRSDQESTSSAGPHAVPFEGGAVHDQADRAVTVMTRNLYVGADIFPVFDALASGDPAKIIDAVSAGWQGVLSTNFFERAEALADEIADAQPLLVGLQEVSLFRTGAADSFFGNPTQAEEVAFDYLGILLAELDDRGLRYAAVSVTQNADAELTGFVAPGDLRDIRLTDRDVILARTDLPASQLQLSNIQSANFATNLSIPIGDTGQVFTNPRGWGSVDAKVRGKTFRFINTHLEVEFNNPILDAIQVAQANELLSGPASTSLPVILVGDFNSRADGTGTATYSVLLGAGFNDAWSDTHPGELGNTFGHDADLRNTTVTFDQRIDLVLYSGDVRAFDADVVGEELPDRTPSGLWPSDHGGVIATLGVPVRPMNDPRTEHQEMRTLLTEALATWQTARLDTESLNHVMVQPVPTAEGSGKAGNADYLAKTGTLTFAPGETTKTITIEVKGDSKKEADETFYLELFGNSSNALFTKNRGLGTILNDD